MLKRALSLAGESLDLLLTLKPDSRGYKIFGKPGYVGGPGTKYHQLSAGAAPVGNPYSTVICLSAVRVPILVLQLLRERGARVIVNQNGVYYPLWSADFEQRNRYLARLNRAASHSFFQSQFALESYRKWVGPLPGSHSVLPNGVDLERFQASEPAGAELRVLVFLDFRESTRELWRYFSRLVKLLPQYRWVLMGKGDCESLLQELKDALAGAPVEWLVSPVSPGTEQAIRGCDASLHFVFNDVCPNKVLECLASGVHVICSSAGGAKELVAQGGGEVLPVTEGYEAASYPDPSAVKAALERVARNRAGFRKAAREASLRFDLSAWTRAMTGLEKR